MRLELEGVRVVVDDDDFPQVAIELGKVLDVLALVESGGVFVEPMHDEALLVQCPGDGVNDPEIGRRKKDDFVVFAEVLKEAIDTRTLGVAPAEFRIPRGVDEGVF